MYLQYLAGNNINWTPKRDNALQNRILLCKVQWLLCTAGYTIEGLKKDYEHLPFIIPKLCMHMYPFLITWLPSARWPDFVEFSD